MLTIFAVAIPTLILFLAMALDIGNWYAHKRKLQNRVDDAVFAAALEYGYRFPDCTATQRSRSASPTETPDQDVATEFIART